MLDEHVHRIALAVVKSSLDLNKQNMGILWDFSGDFM